MSVSEVFNKRIVELENKIYKNEFDISKFFLPQKEIVKNIIREKNPSMKKEDIILMVHGPNYVPPTEVKKNNQELTPLTKSSDSTGVTSSINSDDSPYPLTEGSEYYKEAQRYQDEIKQSATLFMLSKKELTNQLISSLTLLSSSIPGISMMITAPPWNIPAALSMASLVLDSLNDLISKAVKVITTTGPLKKLNLVLSEDSLRKVVRILNPVISIINALLDPIERIKNFILKLIEKIKSLFKSDQCRKQLRRIKRQISKKNIEIAKIKLEQVAAKALFNTSKADSLQQDIEDLEAEIVDLKTQASEIESRCGKQISLEQDLEQLNKISDEVTSESDTWIETLISEAVYDVVLPDGITLFGVTDEQLENLKKDYTIVVVN
jgi:hypothetical protein